jgi:hypothetical protein
VDETKPPKNVGKFNKGKRNKQKKNKFKDQSQGKERNPSSATIVVVLIILQRSAIYHNTWLTCIRNPSKRLEKLNDHMKLTSSLHPMRLQLRARALMKLQSQA